MRRLVLDIPNILFRVAAAHGKYNQGSSEDKAGLALHISLNTILKYYRKYKPNQIAVVFEGDKNWRKAYTKSDECVSKRVYKANRVKDPSMAPYFELMKSFEQLVRQHSSLICLSAPEVEGDDMFGGYVQRFAPLGDEIIGVSGDKDFTQLLKFKNFQLINPDAGVARTCDDPDFFMFEKCIRGDSGDNVMSAYPRVRIARLKKAFTDDYELVKLMQEEHEFVDPETKECTKFKVEDLFVENNLLMNLECQPDNIRAIIESTLDHELANHGKFSVFHFSKFCGKYGLKEIGDNVSSFAEMFSVSGKTHSHITENIVPSKAVKQNSALVF